CLSGVTPSGVSKLKSCGWVGWPSRTIQGCDGVLAMVTLALWRAAWIGKTLLVSALTLLSQSWSACPRTKGMPFHRVVTTLALMLPRSWLPVIQVARFWEPKGPVLNHA